MKILKPGRNGIWHTEATCTGKGNGGVGCEAVLLVEQSDLYLTYYSNAEKFVTFTCPSCGVETDIDNCPTNIEVTLPSKSQWKSKILGY